METVINGASNKKSKKKDKEQGVKRKGSPQVSPNVTPKKKSKKDDVSISVSLNKYNQKSSDEIPLQQKLTKKEKKRLLDRKVLSNDGKMNETAHQEKVTKNKKKRLLNNHVLSGDGKLNDIAKSRKDKKKKKKNKNKNRLLDHHHETAQPKQVTKNKKRLLDVHKMLSRDGEVNEIQHTKEVPKMKILDETVMSAESITNFEELHLARLIKNISKNIPPNDRLMFKLRARTIDWEKIAFERYSPKLCRDVWFMIQGQLRQYRTLSELLNDAKEWTNMEWKENLKPKIHPDFPRRPLTTAFRLYLSAAKDVMLSTQPNLDDVTINKLAKKVYATIEPETIASYEKAAAYNKKKYEEAVEAFYECHPDVRKKKMEEKVRVQNKSCTPFALFAQEQMMGFCESSNTSVIKRALKEEWNTMGNREKLPYIDMALELLKKCIEEAEPDEKPKFVLSKEELRIKEEMMGKPQRPPSSAYALFSQNMFKNNEELNKIPYNEKKKKVGSMWKELSDEEKDKYKEKVNLLASKYFKKYEKYKKRIAKDSTMEFYQKHITTLTSAKTKHLKQ